MGNDPICYKESQARLRLQFMVVDEYKEDEDTLSSI